MKKVPAPQWYTRQIIWTTGNYMAKVGLWLMHVSDKLLPQAHIDEVNRIMNEERDHVS